MVSTAAIIGALLILAGAIISLTGLGAIIGVPMMVLGFILLILQLVVEGTVGLGKLLAGGANRTTNSGQQSTSGGREVLFSGYDHTTIERGSFTYYEFDTRKPSVLEYTIEVFQEGAVNVLLTTEKNLSRFKRTADIQYIPRGSKLNTEYEEVKVHLDPASYALIIDNTDRIEEDDEILPAVDIEIDYEVYA